MNGISLWPLHYVNTLVCGFEGTPEGLKQHSRKIQRKAIDERPETILLCASCHAEITRPDQAIEHDGRQQHRFRNPQGISFVIGLYALANCLAHGEFIHKYSWFPGYAWQIMLCPSCHTHLGWGYATGHSPDFYGLITTQLISQHK